MKYLLDTDHVSFLQRRSGPEYVALAARMARHPSSDFTLCIISFHEQVLGAHTFLTRARTPAEIVRGYNLMVEVLQGFQAAPVLSFDATAVAVFDSLRAQKIRVATTDLRIAATALARGLVLLTRNFGDFSKIPGLVIEDWTV